ncbi:hypothetical protein [Rhizobium lusitanum]|uniref:spike base protein, RCAP_Rcc01079 family n=1 Tax=Rhizobium lusitanum TaxID=293958 RepID=UPI0019580321|nr:hypothetical protein [Rhizobium lusitanum]MBM7045436.1 hypothetical protein [Rhizobium lusitanum]
MVAAKDDYFQYTNDLSSPATHCALVTPSDTVDLTEITRAVAFTAAGTLKVTMQGGETVVIPSGALSPGQMNPMRVTRIWATGTTATGLVAWW